ISALLRSLSVPIPYATMPASLVGPRGKKGAVERGAERGQSVSRLNVLIAITAAIIGLIYGYDLGSIASALLFLVPAFDLTTFMTSVVTSAVVLGQLFGALFAGRISNTIGRKRSLVGTEGWRLILSLPPTPAVIVLVLIVRLPDTARWLLMNGRREEAADLLRRVEPDMDPDEEVQRIEHDLSYEEKGSFAELFQGRFRKAGIFVVGLGFLVQITGINAIVYYSPTI